MHSSEQTIPARLVIGVTGHRKLDNQPVLGEQIRSTIKMITQMVPPLANTPVVPSVLSPLAEGADRLIVREVLKVPRSMLEVVLPLKQDDYVQDFETAESRMEFHELLSRARRVRQLPSKGNRPEAYKQLGRYIVDHCDVLIALWDGKPAAGEGGTGDIVQYARERRCPLFWIHTEDPVQVNVELGQGLSPRPFQDLDRYNSERVDATKLGKQLKDQRDILVGRAKCANVSYDKLRPALEYILYHVVRADLLALHYQRLYYGSGSLVYLLAAAAVALVAVQALFIPDQPMILIAEVVFMVAVLAIVGLARRQRWHTKWIDYRFLAERLRSALFMDVADINLATLRPAWHLSLSYSSSDWIMAAFSSVWSQRPQFHGSDSYSWEGLRDFLCEAWIEEQIRYHDNASKRLHRRHHRMARASNVLFGLALCAALVEVINVFLHLPGSVFVLLAIVFPATAGSITAIRTHRDYLRNSMRSAEMVRYLTELKERMIRAQDRESFLQLVQKTEETMLHENEDWHVVVRFKTPELPA